uniref:Inosine/uridine-preferring nucleoside hydrolase domain-containing protein n=1 Tax=Amphilophus citrinellus TaxID=61819 RepID=A0A3Q0S547_AMPCI
MKKKKLIFDLNTGVADAQALMVALAAPCVEILGITCCYGNTPLESVLKNTLCVLKVCKKLEIPVYQGCSQPLLAKKCQVEDCLGKDGLGDVSDPESPSLDLVQKENGVTALIKMVNQNPGEVSLVATAPLTNLAVAVQLDPSLSKKLKALYIVGGNTDSSGNSTVCREFNFMADPEAARIVLDCYTCPTYIAPWELSCSNSLSWSFCEQLLSQNTEKASFLKKISSLLMKKAQSPECQKELTAVKGFSSCDSYAVAAAIEDAFVTESEEVAVTVELEGTYTRGMMVVDCMELLNKKQKAILIKKVDLEKLKNLFINSLK